MLQEEAQLEPERRELAPRLLPRHEGWGLGSPILTLTLTLTLTLALTLTLTLTLRAHVQ